MACQGGEAVLTLNYCIEREDSASSIARGEESVVTEWKELKAELLADTETQAAYDAVRPRYQLASLLITLRRVTGLSQAAVAKRAGMTQPEISRIEAAEVQPTWRTIQRLLSAFDAEVEVKVRGADGEMASLTLEPAAVAATR